ncbi:hypothetical protein J2S00_001623 [Caldalkalibacillus uzonensis]|uniref:Uncharacterized protein n=2 Tax=Caldalkalibacillus uzonensis TaxID=353224 RepID=A0ABU0CUY3_9BACI|nr:hypothetical protein [Caldalkalibacillus uzonensis]
MDERFDAIEASLEILVRENHENKLEILRLKRAK